MELFLAVLGATGVVMAIAANATSIAKYVGERRRAPPWAAARTDRGIAAPRPPDRSLAIPRAETADAAAPARPQPVAIRTPDQRVRVFVSSTLTELAPERAAARAAIEALRLTPVLFELGARPHPPRDLYRAYLAQSDVFVGIYGERYGWVAPGEDVSGLEDEYRLAAGHPKLVYVRASTTREPGLQRLLDRIRRDDHASYKSFRSAEELAGLIGDDLAVLLSERFVLAGAAAPPAGAPASTPPTAAAPPAAPAAALPPQPTSFVGRDALMTELTELLLRPDVRLLTLYGPGGAGKSRVAVELAARVGDRLGDEVRYVSLAAVRDPLLVASSLAIGLGVQEEVGRTTVGALQQALAGRRGLLVIDNFEHLVEAAPVVADLIAGAPGWTVLVTSRSVLRLRGEVVYPIPPLDLPGGGALAPDDLLGFSAVRLFVERARAVDPHFELDTTNAAAIEEICRRVDALPLAIELAAARVRSLSPAALLARMTRRLPLLSGGPRDAPERQRTLRDAIGWSVALLDVAERSLFERLSVFEGSVATWVVERVLGADDDVLDGVASLVDKSLLQRVDPDEGERFVMLETVREYASEAFEQDPEAAAIRLRHGRAFLELAEEGARALKGSDQTRWQRLLHDDLGNLRAAMAALLAAGATDEALRLATALKPLFMARCHYEEGARLLRTALAAGGEHDGAVRAAAQLALGALTWRQGDLEASRDPIEASLATYRSLGDRAGAAAALRLYGVHAHNSGQYDIARERFEGALALMRQLDDREGIANALLGLGNVAFDRGDAAAAAHYEESRGVAEAIGDTLGIAYALDNLGALAWCHGDLTVADAHTDAVADLYAQLDHPLGHANVAHRRGLLAIARASYEDAERQLRASLAIREAIGEIRGAAFVRHDLGRVALARDDLVGAAHEFAAGLDLAERHGAPLILVLYLEGLAALCAGRGAPDDALELLSCALAWRRTERVPLCAVTRPRHEALVRNLRYAVEPSAWRKIEGTGAALTIAEGVARARACLQRRPRTPPG